MNPTGQVNCQYCQKSVAVAAALKLREPDVWLCDDCRIGLQPLLDAYANPRRGLGEALLFSFWLCKVLGDYEARGYSEQDFREAEAAEMLAGTLHVLASDLRRTIAILRLILTRMPEEYTLIRRQAELEIAQIQTDSPGFIDQ